MTKASIRQAKNGGWTPDVRARFKQRNWLLDLGQHLLIYESFEAAVNGLRTLHVRDLINPYGLVGFQKQHNAKKTLITSWPDTFEVEHYRAFGGQ